MHLVIEVIFLLFQVLLEYATSFCRLFYRGKPKSVEGQVVLVTGAGSGLGRLISLKLAKRGAIVIGWDIDENGLKETQKRVASLFEDNRNCTEINQFSYAKVDITDRRQVYTEAEKIGKAVDILINNAGIVTKNNFLCEKDDIGIVKTFEVNIISHFWTVKAFLPKMMEQNRGHIVTIASVAGFSGSPRITDYAASKFAAAGFHETLVLELRCQGFKDTIIGTLVCPYVVDTGMFEGTNKNKLDFLVPILKQDYVVSKIEEGILYNYSNVIIPKLCSAFGAAKFLLPAEGWAKVVEGFGGQTLFKDLVGR
ncbi:retinol dehydrogenase 10-like [Symsagittifera roscoffensis]|uniref:retinol dehydrogenase 10-like n=1 Tax=Symsagittifera roscoffensis TaxID=84072 RepID=UPI00307C6F56